MKLCETISSHTSKGTLKQSIHLLLGACPKPGHIGNFSEQVTHRVYMHDQLYPRTGHFKDMTTFVECKRTKRG